jgi:hypothetical protein
MRQAMKSPELGGGGEGTALLVLTSALDVGQWSASCPGRFSRGENCVGTHWTRGCLLMLGRLPGTPVAMWTETSQLRTLYDPPSSHILPTRRHTG